MMKLASVFFGILFASGGIFFAMGKLHVHMKVWKSMTEEEKQKIDIRQLCVNIGEMITLSGILFIFNGLWPEFSEHWFSMAMIAWLIVAGADVVYIQKSRRFQQNQDSAARENH